MVLLFQLKEKSLSCVTSLPTSLHKVKIHINTSKPITVYMCVNINYIYANIYACMPAWTCVCFVHFGCRDILAMGVRTCIYARFSLASFFPTRWLRVNVKDNVCVYNLCKTMSAHLSEKMGEPCGHGAAITEPPTFVLAAFLAQMERTHIYLYKNTRRY